MVAGARKQDFLMGRVNGWGRWKEEMMGLTLRKSRRAEMEGKSNFPPQLGIPIDRHCFPILALLSIQTRLLHVTIFNKIQ